MSRNQNWLFLRNNKAKSTWQVSSLLDLPYIHRKLRQTLALCWPQLARVCFSLLWTCWKLNKLETRQVEKLVQHHQNISNPLFSSLVQHFSGTTLVDEDTEKAFILNSSTDFQLKILREIEILDFSTPRAILSLGGKIWNHRFNG